MKKIIYMFFLCFFNSLVILRAQNVKNVIEEDVDVYSGFSYEAGRSVTLKSPFHFAATSSSSFYIKIVQPDDSFVQGNNIVTDIIKVPGVITDAQIYGLNEQQKQTLATYTDGFGRTIQQVDVKSSSNKKNVVTPFFYDNLGRQSKTYLPYVSDENTIGYQTNTLAHQSDFYGSGGEIASDSKPFSVTAYDNSPLNRIIEQGAVGNDWQPGTGHTIKTVYRINTVADNVIKWTMHGPAGAFGDHVLFVAEVTDAKGTISKVFTDKAGRILLRRNQLNEPITEQGNSEYVEWLDTYYVYDDFGNLIYQVPPKAVAKIENGASWNSVFIEEWVFAYTYNEDRLVTERKVPGSGAVYTVYDQLGRAVLSQDAKNRSQNKWFFIKYDLAGRPVCQGIYTYTELYPSSGLNPREQLQKYYNELNYDVPGTYYHEEKLHSGINGYTNRVFPVSDIEQLVVNYYDDYDFDGNGTADHNYLPSGLVGAESSSYQHILGQLTGTKKRILGSNTWLTTAIFYDKYGRVVQKRSNNHLYNTTTLDDVHSVVYEGFSELPKLTKQVKNSSASESITIINQIDYDHRDRLKAIYQSDNGSSMRKVASYNYNKLGQLVNKNIHKETNTEVLQSLDYRYNIRGWLTHINNSALVLESNGIQDIFGMELVYNTNANGLNNTLRYDGQISAVKWKTNDEHSSSANPVYERSYKFNYDKAGRMKDAFYMANNGTGWGAEIGGYDEKNIRYDHNGNILALQRYQLSSGNTTPVLIDDLQYSYAQGKGNQLTRVTDASAEIEGFKTVSYSGDEGYFYDENGSLVVDKNKGDGTTAMTIAYNEIGKTKRVDLPGGNYIQYTYAATGERLSKQVYNSIGLLKTLDYIEGFVYENSALSYYPMVEGRVRNTGTILKYEYFITDHQGNVRVSFEESNGQAKIVQENHYYPFGLGMKGAIMRTAIPSVPNKNLYNAGSELQDDFSDDPNFYSTFFREYDPVLGRMNGIDPMADKYSWLSPYNYAFNNPVNFNDPTGADPWDMIWEAYYDTPNGSNRHYSTTDGLLDPGIDILQDDSGNHYFWQQSFFVRENIYEGIDIIGKKVYVDIGGSSLQINTERDWDAVNTTFNALGLASGIKETIIEAGAALNRGINISKVNDVSLIRTYGASGAKYLKYSKALGVVGSVITTGYSADKVFDQYSVGGMTNVSIRDATDASVGVIGLGATGLAALGLISNPIGWAIGTGVLIYGGATLIYDAVNDR